MQSAVRANGTIQKSTLWYGQSILLLRQEKLCYHPKTADEIDKTQPIDDSLALPYREPLAPMAEPKVQPQVVAGE